VRTRLVAETRAEFPGVKGRAYRALVIDTRAHVLVVRRLLGTVAGRVERARRVGTGDAEPPGEAEPPRGAGR
jgi:hypothetical protein